MWSHPRYLPVIAAALCFCGGDRLCADEERLRAYYERVLEAEPENARARAYLGLPPVASPDSSAAPASEAGGDEDAAHAGEPAPLWKELLEAGDQAAAIRVWRQEWSRATPAVRPGLANDALNFFPPGEIRTLLEEILPAFAPGSRARQSILNTAALRLAESQDAQAVLSGWMESARRGDLQFARAAAVIAAQQGLPQEWAEMLQLQADAGRHPENLWEAWLAAGDRERARTAASALLAREPDSTRAVLAVVELELLEGNEARAAEMLRGWLSGRPPNERQTLSRSLEDFARRLGWSEGGEIALRMRVNADPSDFDARLALGAHLLSWGDPAAAAQVFAEGKGDPDFLERAAALQIKYGFHEDASKSARMAFEQLSANEADVSSRSRIILLLVETLRLSGQSGEALTLLHNELPPDVRPLPPQELDREFFQLLARPELATSETEVGKSGGDSPDSSLALRSVLPVRRGMTGGVRRMLEALEAQTKQSQGQQDEEPWLRLARWQEWTEEPGRAEATLAAGLARHPDSTVLRESALELARKVRNRAREREILVELVGRETREGKKLDWQRELAFLELQSENEGDVLRGLRFFLERAADPSSVAADWRNLALAHEMQEDWFASWQAWCAAWQLAETEEMRAEIRAGGSRTAAKIGNLKRWREWTGAASLAAPSMPPMQNASPNIRTQTPPGQLLTLRARDPDAWLAQMASLTGGASGDEANVDFFREAARRFPRSPAVLNAAAAGLRDEYPGEAATLLLRAEDYSPPDATRSFELAGLLEKSGDRTRAEDAYRRVLELMPPGGDSSISIFPVELSQADRRRLSSLIFRTRASSGTWSGGWAAIMENPPSAPAGLRVRALRALGAIEGTRKKAVAAGEGKGFHEEDWTEQLTVAEVVEFAVAAGDYARALEVLKKHIASEPLDYRATIAFLRLAMQAGLWGDAVEFVSNAPDSAPERLDFFLAALGERILADADWRALLDRENGRPSLPGNFLWPVAQLLAATGHLSDAVSLAKVAIPELPLDLRGVSIEEALQWCVQMGDPDAAGGLLSGVSFPVEDLLDADAALLRARFLLGTQADRSRWLDEFFGSSGEQRGLGIASTRFLLAALAGMPMGEPASRLVDEISTATFGTGDRRMFMGRLRAIVDRLLSWRLEEAASAVVAASLEGDEALRVLRGQVDDWQRGEMQALATATALAATPFADLPSAVVSLRNLLGENRDFLPAVAAALSQSGDSARASLVFQILWEGGDRRPLILSSWWPLVRAIGDGPHFQMLLEELLRRGERVEGLENPHVALIDAALAESNWDLALAVLNDAGARGVQEAGLSERRTALDFLTKNYQALREKHEPLWQEEDKLLSGEILVRTAWMSGDRDGFFALLPTLAAKDSNVFLRVWDAALADPGLAPEEAARLLKIIRDHSPQDPGRGLCAAAAAGDLDAAMDFVSMENGLPTPAAIEFLAARADFSKPLAVPLLEVWADALETRFASVESAKHWQAMDAFMTAAGAETLWRDWLSREWRDGRGDRLAGEILLRSLLRSERSANPDGAERVLRDLIAKGGNAEFWEGLAVFLNESGEPDLTLLVLDAWKEEGIPDERRFASALLRATALHATGHAQGAREVLLPWERMAVLDPGFYYPLAEWMRAHGEAGRSLRLHEEGMLRGSVLLRKAHAAGAARAAADSGDASLAEFYQREADAVPGTP